MFVYLLLFFLVSIPVFLKDAKKTILLAIAVMILVAGFRDMIGGFDVYIYGEVFELPVIRILLFDLFEWGFRLTYVLLRQVAETRETMFMVFSILVLGIHSYQIKKLSPLVGLSLFIYFAKFYLMSFVYLRQGLAMGIVWFAIPLLQDKKYTKALLIVALAFFFHKSSIIFLPFFFICKYKFSSIQIVILTMLLFIVVLSPIGSWFTVYLGELSGEDKIGRYAAKSSGINFFYFIEVLFFGAIILRYKSRFYQNNNVLVLNGFLVYIWVILFSLTNATFIRLGWYYFMFSPIALAYLITYLRGSTVKMLGKLLFYVYYSLIFFRLLLVYDGGDFMPYKATFQDFERNGNWEFMEYRNRNGFYD
ncbi:EpsG family protein [Bacteroidia bacterium]|nr:EpsG family protein [Bacteroidia bacterium]